MKEYKEALISFNLSDYSYENIECIRYEPETKDFYYYIFLCTFQTEKELLHNYEDINESIALNFQSFLEKNIEKWNIYLFCFVQEEISIKTKYIIEQDKYATRKVVFSGGVVNQTIEDMIAAVNNRLFTLNLQDDNDSPPLESLDVVIKEADPRLMDYISRGLNGKRNKEWKDAILEYLEVEKYE